MLDVIVISAYSVVMAVFGILLLIGKGRFLIKYNMISDVKKSKYDDKMVYRVAGIISLIISVMLVMAAVLVLCAERGFIAKETLFPFGIVIVAGIITAVVIEKILTNTICRKK